MPAARSGSGDDVLEAVRAFARTRVRDSSLRVVAKEIGISHPTLMTFIREDSPTDPFGPTRRRLVTWAAEQARQSPARQAGSPASAADEIRAEGFRDGVLFAAQAFSRLAATLLSQGQRGQMPTAEQLEELEVEEDIYRRLVVPQLSKIQEQKPKAKKHA